MNKNGVIAVVVVVISVVLVGLWALRSGEQGVVGGDCAGPPAAPTGVTATTEGNRGRLTWSPAPAGEGVSTYIIEAGSTPGANNQGTFVAAGNATSFEREASGGTYYVRLYARNACGTSPASQEVTVNIR
jgi:hypothetical protein